ncbi:PGF-CTERM protein [Natronoarchaeum philippinense]|uniref:PGF-CTERM protein n=1 Tax=Natronoarchaeum philippinense TaxID=558529 RepID=A0A285NSD7_NATPI|nr:PGF-CTERM sorting domain-containing protein [Natronoarchaeum philippinense]SNZ12432.1 PGF-CTERM protein [Natronoarchaeum philippinense]
MAEHTPPTRTIVIAALAVLVLGGVVAVAAAAPNAQHADPAAQTAAPPGENGTDSELLESEFVVEAPEEGDEYFEAAASDGSWVSYVNPRDEYRDPYLGSGSGKICVTLVNQAGNVVAGESVPDTQVTIPTGETLSWHSEADPIEVQYPLTEHYERPLDADQFGTSPDVAQGDGYLDSHCVEFHGPSENATISYGAARIEGEHADRIDVAGYIQQANMPGWDTDIDPVADAVPYEQVGGWTYRPGASHGQVVVVLQLDPPADDGTGDESDPDDGTDPESGDDGDDGNTTDPNDGQDAQNGTDPDPNGGGNESGEENESADRATGASDDGDSLPGFGVTITLVALSVVALTRARR